MHRALPAVTTISHAHLLPIKEVSLFSAVPKIHIHTNNTALDSPVSLTNATQSALFSLWLCPQHLFTKPSEANRLAHTMVRASVKMNPPSPPTPTPPKRKRKNEKEITFTEQREERVEEVVEMMRLKLRILLLHKRSECFHFHFLILCFSFSLVCHGAETRLHD